MYYLSWSVVKARWISLEGQHFGSYCLIPLLWGTQCTVKHVNRALKYICKTVIDSMFLQDGVWKAEIFMSRH